MRGWLTLFLLAVATPATAQEPRCTDDNGQDRCTDAAVTRQNALYAAPAIDDPSLRGSRVVRAFFVDGYGQDLGMIAFVRAPASDPRVEWRAPRGPATSATMSAIVPLATWNALIADGRGFDRTYAPRPTTGGSVPLPPMPCLHSWVARVETIDDDGTIRRRTQDACGEDSIAGRYAFKLAEAAVATLPACALLDRDTTRNDVTRLFDCARLAGDRAAAAEAYNRFRSTWFANPRGVDFARALQHLFYDQAEVTWPGVATATGSEAASRVWAQHAGTSRFFVRRVFGEGPDRVRIEGEIMDRGATDGVARSVPATMWWTRENGFDFRLRRLTSG